MPKAQIYIKDKINNVAGHDDITANEAAAGLTETYTIPIGVPGNVDRSYCKVYLGPNVRFIEISNDGVSWATPKRVEDAIDIGNAPDYSIPAGDTVNLHVRRTIPAGKTAEPEVLNEFYVVHNGL